MRYILIILISVFLSACSDSQNQKVAQIYNKTFKEPKGSKFTIFEIDTLADITKKTNEKSPAFIKQRLRTTYRQILSKKM